MLASMRHMTDNFLVKLLLLLLIASFALWGIGDIFRGDNKSDVAKVGDTGISEQDFYTELSRLRMNMGEYFTPEILQQLNLFQITLGELISKALILEESRSLHLVVGDELLKTILADDTQFHNDKGLFDRGMFEQRLRQLRMSEKQYLHYLRETTRYDMLRSTIEPNISFDPALVDILYTIEQEQREVLTLLIDHYDPEDIIKPDEAILQPYYDKHKARYMAPEYRILRFIKLNREALASQIVIDEEALRDAYLKRQKELATPEKRNVSQLLYADKAEAEQAYGLLRNDEPFDQVEKAIPPVNAGNTGLGEVTKNQLPAAEDTVFALAKGAFTAPIESEFGWHIFRVDAIIAPQTPSFESLKTELRTALTNERLQQQFGTTLEALEDAVAAGLPLDEIAKTVSLPLVTTEAIDRSGLRNDNTRAVDPALFGDIIDTGFNQQNNEMSDVLQADNGQYYVVQTMQVTPGRERAFQEVRGIVTQDWMNEQQIQARKAYAQKVADALKAANDAAQAAEILQEFNIAQSALVTYDRSGITDDPSGLLDKKRLPQEFAEQLFSLHDTSVVQPVAYKDGNYLVGYTVKTLEPTDKKAEAFVELQQKLESLYEQEVGQQYLNALQKTYPVIQNNDAIERVTSQF